MIKNLYIRTMGCQMNEYDSIKIFDVLKHSHNLQKVEQEANADVLLINTCSIREKSENKLFHQLHRWQVLKQQKPNTIIGVGGCVASQEGDLILQKAPFVDIIFGPQTLHRLPVMLSCAMNNKKSIDVSFPEIEKFDHLPQTITSAASAYVSIMEGCSKYCTFCVVPYTRGEEVSRPLMDIVNEVNSLVAQGVKEIHLLGQNVNAYKGEFSGELVDLAFLIEEIADIDKVKRIRFTTSHPVDFSDRLINVYAKTDKLVSHLHLPVQSGSDNILIKMKRGYTVIEYKDIINRLKQIRPNICISSDFIIGFPGESDDDFNKTIELINAINFDKSFSFIYSKRPGTPASMLNDNTKLKTKKSRLRTIQDLINHNTHKISQAMIGDRQEVLVSGISPKSKKLYGKNQYMRNVHFDGDNSLINELVTVKIVAARDNSLIAELCQ